MPSQEALLTVILVAIVANLVLAVAILLTWRFRDNRAREAQNGAREATRAPIRQAIPVPRPLVPVFDTNPETVPVDPDTQLDVPATWHRWLTEEDARIRRFRRSATVVLIEVAGMDRLVDRMGEGAVERLIPPIATTIRKQRRETDRLARLGTARFGAVLPETGEVQAINFVERMRDACDVWLASGAIALRLSIGWAEANASRSMDLAVEAAEERLNAERRRERVPEPAAETEVVESEEALTAPAG